MRGPWSEVESVSCPDRAAEMAGPELFLARDLILRSERAHFRLAKACSGLASRLRPAPWELDREKKRTF